MVKLVVLSQAMAGRAHELTVAKTTIGRLEDNTFQIPEASVSSHHCEVLLEGSQVRIKDLNSTNGTFINGDKISEAVLNPGQTLRLGQIELRLDSDAPGAPPVSPAPAAPPVAATAAAAGRKTDRSLAMQRGVNPTQFETGGRPGGFDSAGKGFAKKDNKVNKIFLIVGISIGAIIVVLLLYVFSQAGK
jgi:predicted component of type VI protein secretion system